MAQSAVAGVDAYLNYKWRGETKNFREEKENWRREDLEYRKLEVLFAEKERRTRELRKQWRLEDLKQRELENSRFLWTRLKESNRREVEEKATQMRSISWLAALVAGFTMTAPVEFTYNSQNPSQWIVACYAVFSAIVPGLMTVSAVMSVYVLEGITKTAKVFVSEKSEESFLSFCHGFSSGQVNKEAPPEPEMCFSDFWDDRCEKDWRWTFRIFSVGISAFLFLLCFMGFLKFDPVKWIGFGFAAPLVLSQIFWLCIRYWWGTYLTSRSRRSKGIVGSTRKRNLDPFDWHLKPKQYSCQNSEVDNTTCLDSESNI